MPPVTGDENSSLSLVLRSLARLEQAMDALQIRITTQFDTLGERFMPRAEAMSRLDASQNDRVDLRSRMEAETALRASEIRRMEDRMDGLEERRRTERRFAWTVALTSLGLFITLLTLVIAHWK